MENSYFHPQVYEDVDSTTSSNSFNFLYLYSLLYPHPHSIYTPWSINSPSNISSFY